MEKYADYFLKTYGESSVHFMVLTNEHIKTKRFNKNRCDGAS